MRNNNCVLYYITQHSKNLSVQYYVVVLCIIMMRVYVTALQDILNHVIEDLENFLQVLKRKAAAWSELEKKKKKSKRKKHDGLFTTVL